MASRAGTVESQRYYVRLGGAVGDIGESKFGFLAPKESYEGIADELGVVEVNDNDSARGVLFGANFPRPPKVRINYKGTGTNSRKKGSTTRYCDPDKIGRVLNGSLNNAKIKIAGTEFDIVQVSVAS
ncbi:MAG: hypothetical protein AAFU71_12020 [Cyanobacteria bacterium J06632_22]